MVPVCFNKFFRLPICIGKDCLLVNTARNSVSSIQFNPTKLLQSWELEQQHLFSCPVVYNDCENLLLSVIDKNTLVTWDFGAVNLEKAKKIKFQEDIFAILSVLSQQVVVFNSGSCLLLEDAISKHEFLTNSYLKNEKLLWVDAAAYGSSLMMIFLLTHTCSGEYKLHRLSLSTSDGKIEKSGEQVIARDAVSLQSWCIKSEDMHASFLTMWSDGQVHCYTEDCKSPVHLLTVPGVEEKELLAVEALDACHIVIVRSNPSSGCSYELWDTRYSTRKTYKAIDSDLSQNLQVKVLGDTLFLPSNECIVAEPLKVAFSTLAAAVGKSSSNTEAGDLLYSWTSDGILHQESVEEEACHDVSNSTFCTVTTNQSFEELLTKLHQADADTISLYLRGIKLISESKLVKLLQHLLREIHPDFNQKACAKGTSLKNPAEDVAALFLDLFCIPYNDIFLQQHLRKLSFKEAMATFEILHVLLNKDTPLSECHDDDNRGFSPSQIARWTCLLLSSHLEEFMLSTENELTAFGNFYRVLRDKVKKCEMKNLLQFEPKEFHFESSSSTEYCIESLHL